MTDLTFSDIQALLDSTELSRLPVLNISILRNITIEQIEPYLRYLALKIGFNARVRFGQYDNILQDAANGQIGLVDKDTDFVVIFSKMENLSRALSRNYNALSEKEIQAELDRIGKYISMVLSAIRVHTEAAILWHGFELRAHPALGILEDQNKDGQQTVINRLNENLKTILAGSQNAYFVNLNQSLIRLGFDRYYDLRYWHIAQAPYTRLALGEIASEDFKYIRALKGKNKKCLVLDCDNVLWGGIVGEDGLAGIKLARNFPGSAFFEFQQEILNLYNRGVIIALCSKNNEEDVWEVFRKHPDMLLKEEHIATSQINWNNKVDNLKRIASDLNIGLDSILFVDDSEFELNLIGKFLPEVEVIRLNPEKTVEYGELLASCGWFDTLILSGEDKNRGAMYRAEVSRKKLEKELTNLEDFYRSLEMRVVVQFADEISLPRISQLTQRTNQFNLTTKRYSETEIRILDENPEHDLLQVRLIDKFGDLGIIGCCIIKYENKTAVLDTYLLSCRALGRGVEDVFCFEVLKLAKKRGYESAIGIYIATKKNTQVKDFYLRQGFQQIDKNDYREKVDGLFSYDLREELRARSWHFKEVISEVDSRE